MVTMKDIAEVAKLNKATVSYILNGKSKEKHISDATADRVKRIARELGYCRDDIARAMSTGKSNVVGFVSSNVTYEFIAEILAAAMERASTYNHLINLITLREGMTADDIYNVCKRQKLCGLICYNLNKQLISNLAVKLKADKVPLVIPSNSFAPDGVSQVYGNDYQGGSVVAQYLYELGHRKLAFIGQNSQSASSKDRKRGFREKAVAMGMAFEEKYCFFSRNDAGIIAFVENAFADKKKRPTAVFCPSDLTALIVLTTLLRIGCRVPEDVSIIGYGNNAFARSMNPCMTSIAEDYSRTGTIIVDHLLDFKRNNQKCLVDVSIVERESTGRAPVYNKND